MIFISYRRGEDAGFAGRLFDRLVPTFRSQRLFMDVDSIPLGQDFVSVLEARVAECDVMLALIGRGWLATTDRLDNPDDFVRVEIASGLAGGKRVIPVLFDDVAMPRREQLPEELKPLARRQGVRLSHESFRTDSQRLIRALKEALADAAKARQVESVPGTAQKPAELAPPSDHPSASVRPPPGAASLAVTAAPKPTLGDAAKARRGKSVRPPPGAASLAITAAAKPTLGDAAKARRGKSVPRKAPDPISAILAQIGRNPGIPSSLFAKWPSGDGDWMTIQKAGKLSDHPDFAVFRDVDGPWCPELVALPSGKFLMGSRDTEKGHYAFESPQHEVTIERRYAIGRFPVTFEEYDHFCTRTGRQKPGDRGWGRHRRPVINVSWQDARDYADWLTKETGQAYRLPSEAEWEYACRAGTTTPYAFGDEITPKDANYKDSGNGRTTEVGAYPPNPWGLHDMHGNVWDWIDDVWHDSYAGAPTDGSVWIGGEGREPASRRVNRGGSRSGTWRNLRSAFRYGVQPDYRSSYLGFRVARTLN